MKVLVKIKNNTLSFHNRKKLNQDYKNMLNTNVISNDELVFSDAYINENIKLVSTFFNVLIKTYDINTIYFQTIEVAKLIIPFINKIKNINTIYFDTDEMLPYKFCEKLCKQNDLKYISAGYIPQYMFEEFDKNDIIPESRNEILFSSKFMETNGLNTYASLYYKYSIYLDLPLTKNDIEDFNTFCKINKHLKIIHIIIPDKINIEEIINILKEYKHKNIKIIIHNDNIEHSLFEYLKKHNKEFKKKYKITFKLKYSDKYISDNIMKETNNTILRSCAFLILFIVILSVGYVFYDNYKSMLDGARISEEINNHITSYEVTNEDTEKYENNSANSVSNEYFYALKDINPDTVAWITINNTNVDYPVLKHDDNRYYLNHNIYNEKDDNGWLFMDYNNNEDPLDDNTIIYGHNRYVNGVMFGTLSKVLNKSWYENEDNLIINLSTLYGNYKFKIFSIYVIKTTSDYLITSFIDNEDKLEFFKLITERSINDFNVDINENTKILTLSTCQSDTSRLVVHAALISKD